jgi:hypothetical protein
VSQGKDVGYQIKKERVRGKSCAHIQPIPGNMRLGKKKGNRENLPTGVCHDAKAALVEIRNFHIFVFPRHNS